MKKLILALTVVYSPSLVFADSVMERRENSIVKFKERLELKSNKLSEFPALCGKNLELSLCESGEANFKINKPTAGYKYMNPEDDFHSQMDTFDKKREAKESDDEKHSAKLEKFLDEENLKQFIDTCKVDNYDGEKAKKFFHAEDSDEGSEAKGIIANEKSGECKNLFPDSESKKDQTAKTEILKEKALREISVSESDTFDEVSAR